MCDVIIPLSILVSFNIGLAFGAWMVTTNTAEYKTRAIVGLAGAILVIAGTWLIQHCQ